MEKLYIVCVEDQREVLDAVSHDLNFFSDAMELEECESVDEAEALLEEIEEQGDYVAVIVSDHVMPGKSGIEFLSGISKDSRFNSTRKILLTGLATHQDTIAAINQAAIDRYIEKPWKKDDLINAVKSLLTAFILEKEIDYQQYTKYLDQVTLFNILKRES
jgi:two-component system chemotaxis response regulator CheY